MVDVIEAVLKFIIGIIVEVIGTVLSFFVDALFDRGKKAPSGKEQDDQQSSPDESGSG